MNQQEQVCKVVNLSNNDILPNRFQPRKYFDEEEILQLSESIKEHGVINPIIVRKLGDKYELVAGERRYKANILAGNDSIPSIIMDVNDKESSEIAVVENIQRKDLNAIEEAISYKRILDIGYMTQEQLAQKMGKSQSAIANKIRLLKLSDEVQDAVMKKEISERHARSLLKLTSIEKQNEMLKRIITERLTVRKTDEEIDKMNNNLYNNSDAVAPIMPNSNITDINISQIPQPGNNSINIQTNPMESGNMMNGINLNNASAMGNINENNRNDIKYFNQNISSEVNPIENKQQIIQPSEKEMVKNDMITNQLNDDGISSFNFPNQDLNSVQATKLNQFSSPKGEFLNSMNSSIPPLNPIEESPQSIKNQIDDSSAINQNSMNYINSFDEKSSSVNNVDDVKPVVPQPIEKNIQSDINIFNDEENTNKNVAPEVKTINESVTPPLQNFNENLMGNNSFNVSENKNSINDNNLSSLNFINENETQNMDNNLYQNKNQNLSYNVSNGNDNVHNFSNITTNNIDNNNSTISLKNNYFPNNDNISFSTSPIIDTTQNNNIDLSVNDDNSTNNSIDNSRNINNQYEKIPEPIIVNDYNQQYDPIMPDSTNNQPAIDFKTIINLIRKCSQAIENSGYKIETEEYNLDNLYQVVFKIEKKN